jgi:hypothetical protein
MRPDELARALTRAVIAAVQRDGTCWAGGIGHANLGVELVDDRGRHRSVGRRDRGGVEDTDVERFKVES